MAYNLLAMKKVTLPLVLFVISVLIVGAFFIKRVTEWVNSNDSNGSQTSVSDNQNQVSTAEFLATPETLQATQDQAIQNLVQEIDAQISSLEAEKELYLQIKTLREQRQNQDIAAGSLNLQSAVVAQATNDVLNREINTIENQILELQLHKTLLSN